MSADPGGERPAGAERAPLPVTVIDDARLAQAWGHPLRIRAMLLLEQEAMSTKELADTLGDEVTLENLSYHVRKLRDLGFLAVDRVEQHRGRKTTYYRAIARPQIAATAWGQLPGHARSSASRTYLRQTMGVIAAAHAHHGFDHPESWIARSPLAFDDEGFSEASAKVSELLSELDAISTRSLQRIQAGEAQARPGTFVGLLFDTPPARAVAAALQAEPADPED